MKKYKTFQNFSSDEKQVALAKEKGLSIKEAWSAYCKAYWEHQYAVWGRTKVSPLSPQFNWDDFHGIVKVKKIPVEGGLPGDYYSEKVYSIGEYTWKG